MRFKFFVVLATTICVCNCGGGGSGSSSSNTQSASPTVSGNWRFSGNSTPFGLTFTGNGTLQQNGSSVTGQITLSGSPCATTAILNGTIMGTTFTFQLQEGLQAANFNGTLNSALTSASGNYTSPFGGCLNGDFGKWTATKQ